MKQSNTEENALAIDRLVLFIRTINVSFKVFERSIGVSNCYIGNQLKRRGSISSKILNKILLEYPELNITWLLTGHARIIPRNSSINRRQKANFIAS